LFLCSRLRCRATVAAMLPIATKLCAVRQCVQVDRQRAALGEAVANRLALLLLLDLRRAGGDQHLLDRRSCTRQGRSTAHRQLPWSPTQRLARKSWPGLVRRRRDVARWVGRRRWLRGRIRRRTNECAHGETSRRATPVRSAVIVAVAAPATTAADVHVATGIDVGIPIGTHVPIRADVRRVTRIRRIAVKVVAVEVAAACAPCGGPLPAAATPALLHQDHAGSV